MKPSRRQLANYAVSELLAGTKVSLLANRLAAALLESGKVADSDLLLEDISSQLEASGKLARASVISAHPISNSLKTQLSTALEKSLPASKVVLSEELDKSLLGGVQIETANRRWDLSIAKQLDDLREAF